MKSLADNLPTLRKVPEKYGELFKVLYGFQSDDFRQADVRKALPPSFHTKVPGLEVNMRDIITIINLRSIEYKELKQTHPVIDDSNQLVNVFGYSVIWATRL